MEEAFHGSRIFIGIGSSQEPSSDHIHFYTAKNLQTSNIWVEVKTTAPYYSDFSLVALSFMLGSIGETVPFLLFGYSEMGWEYLLLDGHICVFQGHFCMSLSLWLSY
jgi:hypothetical protein